MQFKRSLRVVILLWSALLLVAQTLDATEYKACGRIVDSSGNPVRGTVMLRVAHPSSPDALMTFTIGQDGRFCASDSSTQDEDTATLFVDSPPPDTQSPIGDIKGRPVYFGASHHADLGDIENPVHYGVVLVGLRDETGKALQPGANQWQHLKLRVHNSLRDVVYEQEVGIGLMQQNGLRKNESALAVALPFGRWTLDVAIEGENEGWNSLDVGEFNLTRATDNILANVTLGNNTCPKLSGDVGAEAAKRKLEDLGVPFSAAAFVEKAKKGNINAISLFLQAGMSSDVKDGEGATALMRVAEFPPRPEIACLLLGRGAAVDARDKRGATALYAAAHVVNTEVLRQLIAHGADVNIPDDKGWTPLMNAAVEGQEETVRLLLAAGADARLRNKDGQDALALAFKGNEEVLDMMQSHTNTK